MGASCFVGRVGGLALALGVGVAIFSGAGAAFADTGDGDAATAAPSGRADSSASTATRTAAGSRSAHGARRGGSTPAAAAARTDAAASSASAPEARASVAGQIESAAATVSPAADESTASASADAGDAGDSAPLDGPAELALLAATSTLGSAAAGATASNNGVTVNPTTTLLDGVIQGVLGAVSSTGQTLTYSFVSSSAGGKLKLGDVPGPGDVKDPQSYTFLPYATWLDNPGSTGAQTFTVRVSEVTAFDQFITGLPLIGLVAGPVISLLQQAPLISTLLAPVIGGSVDATVLVNVEALAPGDTPVAFTYKVSSFDGVLISTDYFPATDLAAGETAFTVLDPPGLGGAGETDPYTTYTTSGTVPGVDILRDNGYNVITWDPRGEFASTGILQLDNPFYEGRDTSAIIDWVAKNTPAELDGPGDPAIGMVGGSYGGGIQMTTVDPRIEAIVPTIAWNSLNESLYPTDIFKTAWANVLALSLLTTGARANNQIWENIILGNLLGIVTESGQAVLASSGPTALLNQLQAPTLLVQGTVDALFPLAQSVQNAQGILNNPYGVPVRLIWFCGGHGICLDTGVDQKAQAATIFAQDVLWLDNFVKGDTTFPVSLIPNFQWWDQAGKRWTSDLYPFDAGFNQPVPLSATSDGGRLGILPFAIGGSGPNTTDCAVAAGCSWPLNQVFATEAPMAINIPITPTSGSQIVGAPTVSFTYSGLGTSRAVYAQVVDNATGRVLGNIVTPIPVTLDGQQRTVTAQIADIAYTAGTTPSLTLQIVGGASLYLNSSFGLVDISNVEVELPVRARVG